MSLGFNTIEAKKPHISKPYKSAILEVEIWESLSKYQALAHDEKKDVKS